VYRESAEYTESAPVSASASASAEYTKPFARGRTSVRGLANGNKTCPSLLVFKNNNVARGS